MKKYLYCILFASIGLFSSCDETISCPGMEEHNNDAVLRWTGDYAIDGCGFIIEMDQVEYKAENENIINESFKVDSDVNISLTYETLHDEKNIICGETKNPVYRETIRIVSIEKK
jgi:hypothetical protein